MTISRRQFLGSSTALAAVATTSTFSSAEAQAAPVLNSSTAGPDSVIIALNRMGYGPRPGDIERVRGMGVDAYITEQLNPSTIDDSECDTRLSNARLKISYAADSMAGYPARHEALPLETLNQELADLWPRARGVAPYQAWAERRRPADEVRVATWLRAIHSKRQLFEVLVDFWHNHFNVSINTSTTIAATFPLYDRLIRSHALGNFRTFVEEVGKSIAMMYYLNNVSNRVAGGEGGNENYARELIELHTLGSDNYFKFYDNREGIGTITYNGKQYARGYIDDDVYEAARCFTGWTIKNGHWEFGSDPTFNTGEFYYRANWHDTNPKMVLSVDGRSNIPRNQADMKDGKDVYDILAGHPGTARYICTKLCRRLIADNPPSNVINAAVDVWMANIDAADQIKRVVEVILRSNEFKTIWGQKIKRPFEAIVSYFRATNAVLPNDEVIDPNNTGQGNYWGGIFWNVRNLGQNLFEWPTPTGHPDVMSHWASSNGMLNRWNLPYVLTQSWGGNVQIDIVGQTDLNASCTQIVDFWIGRLFGYSINTTVRQELIAFLAQGGDVNQPPRPRSGWPDWNNMDGVRDRLRSMVQLMAMAPDFHTR